MEPEKIIGNLLSKYQARFAGESAQDITKYQHYINSAAKLTGNSYMQMHRRITHAFPEKPLTLVLSKLSEWVHYAEKADNRSMAFNGLFKKYRESSKPTV